MTLAEMLTDLTTRIGVVQGQEVNNTQLTFWLNEALKAFCSEDEFNWLEKRVTSSAVADQAEYSLPSDWRDFVEVRVDPTDSDPGVYRFLPYEQRFGIDPTEKTYSVVGSVIRLTPTPSEAGSNNIYMTYLRVPGTLTTADDSPSDSDIASMPVTYHPALVAYAYALYKTYDDEFAEFESLVGSANSPRPGTYSWYVQLAKKQNAKQKRGERRRILTKQEAIGYTHPNRLGRASAVLKI